MAFDPVHWIKPRIKQALAPLARRAMKSYGRVLMYHRFGPGDPARTLSAEGLDEQLQFLRRHFNVLPLSELVACLKSGALEPYSVAITVDDAYADFGVHAYPVFQKNGVPVTVYVVSEFAGGRLWLWWDIVRYLVNRSPSATYHVHAPSKELVISLTDAASRHNAWLVLAEIGVALGPGERERYIGDLKRVFSVPLPADPPQECAALSWDDLRAFDPHVVEVGAHTRTHPSLVRCDANRLLDEVAGCKAEIEAQVGRRVSAFCYPNGEWSDIDERCIAAVRDAGYDSAVMACGAVLSKGANPYALNRMPAPHVRSDFESDVSGISYLRRAAAGRASLL